MKTVPFNAEQAKAGRLVLYGTQPVKIIATDEDIAWCIHAFRHVTFHFSRLSHPADPAPGHNPEGLDEWTVGVQDGWRLLERAEIDRSRIVGEEGVIHKWVVQRWDDGEGRTSWCGNNLGDTYRTRRPPGYFMPKITRRNIRQDELPESFLINEGTGTWVVHSKSHYGEMAIQRLVDNGCFWSRSLDGPWRTFTVEEKQ